MLNFVALDFETADGGRDSACAIGLVRVAAGQVTNTLYRLIRPPRRAIMFEHIHGISWAHVADQPTFGDIGAEIVEFVRGADFLAAHNASFDRGVLEACCDAHSIAPPGIPFVCTVKLARAVWNIYPTKLPNVCTHLDIDLDHHQALSDALACAHIVLRAAVKCSPLAMGRLGA